MFKDLETFDEFGVVRVVDEEDGDPASYEAPDEEDSEEDPLEEEEDDDDEDY